MDKYDPNAMDAPMLWTTMMIAKKNGEKAQAEISQSCFNLFFCAHFSALTGFGRLRNRQHKPKTLLPQECAKTPSAAEPQPGFDAVFNRRDTKGAEQPSRTDRGDFHD